ncbi:hypothetical protein R83H12_02528 [Fibrobacteria bacterium R8-3-H12]
MLESKPLNAIFERANSPAKPVFLSYSKLPLAMPLKRVESLNIAKMETMSIEGTFMPAC